ncbi:MAG: hypothetical protein M1840_006153 [Geoglossum simile]|nr:MAG: hypothetical protein M1840_006153 [Geoglossum simile]
MENIDENSSDVTNAKALVYGAFALLLMLILALFSSSVGKLLCGHRGYQARGSRVVLKQPPGLRLERSQDKSLALYKQLYFKLHNLEDYPEILPQARNELISLLSSSLLFKSTSGDSGILSCSEYAKDTLRTFLQHQQDEVFTQWEQYVLQRKGGGPRQMFKDRQDAIYWLKQMAPLKYVDGAWLGHINRVTTPLLFRGVVKNAWQILSEEYGDGDLKKHHVYVYQKLMQELVPELPGADSIAFIESYHGLTDMPAWKTAVAQLLISLFPHEFLPEILGYNMHYESIKLQTLVAAKELRELNIDPYYFNLHTSIDNADSGHTAIALHAAEQYLETIKDTYGVQEKGRAWKRIQAGFALSEYLEEASPNPEIHQPEGESPATADVEKRFIDIIRAKSLASEKIHSCSGVKLEGRKLAEWLNPTFLSSPERQAEFVRCLSNANYWVQKGNSEKSRLVRELSWGGRMFGSFTSSEVGVVKAWIESLDKGPQLYWSFSERPMASISQSFHHGNILTDYPVFSSSPLPDLCSNHLRALHPDSVRTAALNIATPLCMATLLPLWFTHTCLLQSLISIPFKSITIARCAVLRFLRVQAGFGVEDEGVAGMDEAKRTDVVGIVELGLEMARNTGLVVPQSLKEALEKWPSEFAITMLHLSMHPNKNAGLLIGLSWAFVDLHDAIASGNLLSQESCVVLFNISRRERECLIECIDDLKCDDIVYQKVCQAYAWGRDKLQNCFGSASPSYPLL